MQKLALLVTGLALVLLAPAQAATVSVQPRADPGAPAEIVDIVSDFADPANNPGMQPQGYRPFSCGGTAPAVKECTTNRHFRSGPGWFGGGDGSACSPPTPNFDYTCDLNLPEFHGIMRGDIIYSPHMAGQYIPNWNMKRSLDCFYEFGVLLGCALVPGSADPPYMPPLPTGYVNEAACLALGECDQPLPTVLGMPATTYEHTCETLAFDTGEPGGVGKWACFTYHNVDPQNLIYGDGS